MVTTAPAAMLPLTAASATDVSAPRPQPETACEYPDKHETGRPSHSHHEYTSASCG